MTNISVKIYYLDCNKIAEKIRKHLKGFLFATYRLCNLSIIYCYSGTECCG